VGLDRLFQRVIDYLIDRRRRGTSITATKKQTPSLCLCRRIETAAVSLFRLAYPAQIDNKKHKAKQNVSNQAEHRGLLDMAQEHHAVAHSDIRQEDNVPHLPSGLAPGHFGFQPREILLALCEDDPSISTHRGSS
jgi:hypothetical protein